MHDEHSHQGYQPDEVPDEAGRKGRPDADEDAEGHVFAARTGEVPDAGDDPSVMVAPRPDADDDVEGHIKAKRSGEAAPKDDEGGEGVYSY